MSASHIIGGGVAVLRRRAGTVCVWAALYAVLALGGLSATAPFLARLPFARQADGGGAAGQPPPFPSEFFGVLILIELAMAVLAIVGFAAAVRAVRASGPDRFAFLRIGWDELRLVVLGLITLAAGIAVEIGAVIVLVLIGIVAKLLAGSLAMGIVVAVLSVVALGAFYYAAVRLSLAPVLTVLRGRIAIGAAWRATRGRFWTLFGVYVLISLAYFLIALVLFAIANPGLLGAYASMDPRAINAAAAAQFERQAAGLSVGMVVQVAVSAVLMVGTGVAAVGAITTAALAWAEPGEGGDRINGSRATWA